MAAAFQYRGQLNGAENPVTLDILIGNSSTVAVGEAVKLDSVSNGGGVIRATAGSKVLGIIVGLIDSVGIDLDNTAQTLDGTYTASSQTYLSASDNTTVKKVKARVVVDENALWYNDTAATLTVAHLYKGCDLTSATQIASTTPSDTVGAFLIMKVDPDADADASKAIVKIAESYLNSYAQA